MNAKYEWNGKRVSKKRLSKKEKLLMEALYTTFNDVFKEEAINDFGSEE